MKINDKVWIFDINHRVYESGDSTPVFRKHFVECYIIGETTQSWILAPSMDWSINFGIKYKKKNPIKEIYESQEEIDNACWINDNRYNLSEKIHRCNNYEILSKINKLLTEVN